MKRIIWLSVTLVFLALFLAGSSVRPRALHDQGNPFHGEVFRSAYGGLPDTTNGLFAGSGKCAGCHAADPNHYASIAGQTYPAIPMPDGWDVNVTDQWRSSLMANSAKDPFWRAKVRHEVMVNPDHQLDLEDKCTSCHAPLGHFAAHAVGETHYTMASMVQDSLALDGVSCVACHQQSAGAANQFSGELMFDDSVAYGPYGLYKDEPLLYALPMITYTGYVPQYGEHIANGDVCAGCHTLITQTTDAVGNYTGDEYVEQATYHEWLNSVYADDGAEPQTCNDCHIPRIDDPVIISSGYSFLEPRFPFGLHTLVGGNAQMLEILRDHVEELGLTATEDQFDSTLQHTRDMLRNQTLELDATASWIDAWGGSMEVTLTNKAGHKFPSGYPSRRAWIEVIARSGTDTLWHSGAFDNQGNIVGVDAAGLMVFEPHHTDITESSQVQIYELVAADVDGNPTNVLERASISLKDNRIAPKGFSYTHPTYDTTRVEGLALDDSNFNVDAGSHTIQYSMVPDDITPSGSVEIDVRVWYQSMPPRWVSPMFAFQDEAIQSFQAMFESQGAAPEVVADTTILVDVIGGIGGDGVEEDVWRVFPNPTVDGRIRVRVPDYARGALWELYAPDGTRIATGQTSLDMTLQLPLKRGTYLLQWHPDGLQPVARRIIRR